MDATNKDSMRRHPAAGGSGFARRSRCDTPGIEAGVFDLATERAIRLLAQAGMIAPTTVPQRRGTVR
jgi:hypothetical protein